MYHLLYHVHNIRFMMWMCASMFMCLYASFWVLLLCSILVWCCIVSVFYITYKCLKFTLFDMSFVKITSTHSYRSFIHSFCSFLRLFVDSYILRHSDREKWIVGFLYTLFHSAFSTLLPSFSHYISLPLSLPVCHAMPDWIHL